MENDVYELLISRHVATCCDVLGQLGGLIDDFGAFILFSPKIGSKNVDASKKNPKQIIGSSYYILGTGSV